MKSEWIMDMGEVWICRNCGEPCKDHFIGKPRWNYCPWCGADMKAEQTEPIPTMVYPQVDGITPSLIKVGYAIDSVTGEVLGETLDTDCGWK